MSQPIQPDPDARLIYVRLLLARIPQYALLYKKWLAMRGTGKQALEYHDAMSAAMWAMRDQMGEFAREARGRGQLLFCFEGTTVVEGGAK